MGKNTRLVPAVLVDNPKALENMVHQVETFTDFVQFDIMDGKFVPSQSITWEHLARLPMKLDWEVHLMVLQPEDCLKNFKAAGAQKIIFHHEATTSPHEVISQVRELGVKVGLAVNPETPVAAILPAVSEVDSVLFMSVHPGFYGSTFIPEVLNKIAELRNIQPDIEIGIDGGIKETNIAEVSRSGVDYICVGSAIFRQPHPAESFYYLKSLVQ